MRTEIQALIDTINISIKNLINLTGYSHTSDDISAHVKAAGAAIERFLKDAVYNTPTTRDNFVQLIDRLEGLRADSSTIEAFHGLRHLYNSLKHNAAFSTSIDETVIILKKAVGGLNDLKDKNIGNVNRTYRIRHTRNLWISAWDHYMSGETEISIFLPEIDTLFPSAIEHFNIKWDGWEPIKEKYTINDQLRLGPNNLPETVYNFWKNEGDFIGAGVFLGDLKELLTDLSKYIDYETENRLLPGLKREDDFYSTKSAIAFSLWDAFVDNTWITISDLQDELFLRAAYDYGISISSHCLKSLITDLSPALENFDRNRLITIDEILWVRYDNLSKHKVSQQLIPSKLIFINADNKIVCGLPPQTGARVEGHELGMT
jgi:hypothetical protein